MHSTRCPTEGISGLLPGCGGIRKESKSKFGTTDLEYRTTYCHKFSSHSSPPKTTPKASDSAWRSARTSLSDTAEGSKCSRSWARARHSRSHCHWMAAEYLPHLPWWEPRN